MNLVDAIGQELSGGLLNKLSSLTGQGEMKTKMAVAAAVPAVLSSVGRLASTPEGAEKVAVMARKFTPAEMAAINDMTTGQAGALFEEGKSALTGLFDTGTLTTLLSSLSQHTHLDIETVKKLLGYLTPIIFGTMTKKFGVDGLTGSTVSALFAEQNKNIADAVPPGMAVASAQPHAAGGSGSLLLILVIALAIALGAYWWFVIRPGQNPDTAPAPVKAAQ